MGTDQRRHFPVMLHESLQHLDVRPGGLYIDATVGGGGHAAAILERNGAVLGIDRDPEALEYCGRRLGTRLGKGLTLKLADFRDLRAVCRDEGVRVVDGILADLGLSSLQLDDPSRGFSFAAESALDMRFDRRTGETAADLLQGAAQQDIARWLREAGEERFAGRLARAITRARASQPITTTTGLRRIVEKTLPSGAGRRGSIHPATRVFMAVRIAVNRELEGLSRFFDDAASLLREGGRLVVIAFHSGEDRIVKQQLLRLSGRCACRPRQPACTCGAGRFLRILTRRPHRPGAEEVQRNPRARSARLRAAERLPHEETGSGTPGASSEEGIV